MAYLGQNTKRERYQWLWKIVGVECKENERNIGVPMEQGDRLFVFFVSEFEVCFHRRGKKGFINDSAWDNARGCYNPNTDEITGQIVDDDGKTTIFCMSIEIDNETGAGTLTGRHFYNPETADWTARD